MSGSDAERNAGAGPRPGALGALGAGGALLNARILGELLRDPDARVRAFLGGALGAEHSVGDSRTHPRTLGGKRW